MSTKTFGNEYDKYDYSFYKELLWKTDKLNIRFVKRRYPVNLSEPSSGFFFVLMYEFNDDVRKKYNLTKEKDLSQTF